MKKQPLRIAIMTGVYAPFLSGVGVAVLIKKSDIKSEALNEHILYWDLDKKIQKRTSNV